MKKQDVRITFEATEYVEEEGSDERCPLRLRQVDPIDSILARCRRALRKKCPLLDWLERENAKKAR